MHPSLRTTAAEDAPLVRRLPRLARVHPRKRDADDGRVMPGAATVAHLRLAELHLLGERSLHLGSDGGFLRGAKDRAIDEVDR